MCRDLSFNQVNTKALFQVEFFFIVFIRKTYLYVILIVKKKYFKLLLLLLFIMIIMLCNIIQFIVTFLIAQMYRQIYCGRSPWRKNELFGIHFSLTV